MQRTISFAAAWLVAAVVALVVAWQGVSVVADQVTDRRPAPLGAEEVRRQLENEAAAATPTTATPTTAAPGIAALTTTSTVAITTSTNPSRPAPPTTPPPTTVAPPPATPPSTTAPPPAAETRTYNLVGGSAALSFSAGGVSVVFATPEPGFAVDVEPQNGNGVRVEFESEGHRSRVDAWWDGGPQERVREEPD